MVIHLPVSQAYLLWYLFTCPFSIRFPFTASFRQLILSSKHLFTSFLLSSKIKGRLKRSLMFQTKSEKQRNIVEFLSGSWRDICLHRTVGDACSAISPRLIRSACVREINNPDRPLPASLQRNLYTRRFITGETIL